MKIEDTEREKSEAKSYTIRQKLLSSVASFVKGPAQAYIHTYFRGFGPLAGGIASLAGAVGFQVVSATANYLSFSAQKQNVLNCYRDELAVALQKNRDSVTIDDLKHYVAQPETINTPIANDYGIISKNEHVTQTKSFFKNVCISAAVVGFAVITGPAFALSMMGYASIGAITLALDIVGDTLLEKWQNVQRSPSVNFIRAIQSEMSRGPVQPTRLMEYSVAATPQLQSAIRKTFDEDYSSLSYQKKNQAIQMFGLTEPLKKITADLNDGKIRASELPFLLTGKDSPSTHYSIYTEPKKIPAAQVVETTKQPNQQMHENIPAAVVHSATLKDTLKYGPEMSRQMH